MKHKRSLISITLAAIVLVAMCVVCVSPLSVSATASSSAKVEPSIHLARTSVASAPTVHAPALVGSSGTPGALAVCSDEGTQADYFTRGADGALWWRESTTTTWTSLGGQITGDPAAVSQTNGVMDVFVRGTDGALWSKYTTDYGATWTAWSKIGGGILAGTGPTAYSWGTQRLGVFFAGTDHSLSHIWVDKWGQHSESVGGYLTSSPAATALAAGRIDVFMRDYYSHIVQRTYTDGTGNNWGPWINLGGMTKAGTSPAATSYRYQDMYLGTQRGIDVFVTSMDNHLYWNHWNGATWTGFTAANNLNGVLTSSPGAWCSGVNIGPPTTGNVYVFVRGISNGLYYRYYNWGTWGPWVGPIP